MPKQDLNHVDAVRAHAIRRLWQRFGIAITNAEYAALTELIRAKLLSPDGWTRSGRPVWVIQVRHRTVYVGWHSDVLAIGTFHGGEDVV